MSENKPKHSIYTDSYKSATGEWIVEYEHGETILEALKEERVFEVQKQDNGTVELREACDGVYSARLTKPQLLQLIEELKQLAES